MKDSFLKYMMLSQVALKTCQQKEIHVEQNFSVKLYL